MPKLNARGDIAAGVGGGVVSAWLTEWDAPRVVIPYQAGGAEWVDDNRIIGQHCDGVCRLKTWDRRTGALVTVAEHGASALSAGGGEWASWLGSLPGIADSLGRRFPTSGLGPMGPTGELAIKVEYQSAGPWDVVERNGSRWRLTDGDAGNINLLGQGRAVWSEAGGVISARGLVAPLVLGMPFWWLKVVEIAGAWWTLYQEARGLLLHDARGRGDVIATGNTFRPDVVQLPNGRVRIVWSRGAAEHPDEIEFIDRDLASLRVDLRVLPPPPPPPPPPKDDPMPIRDHGDLVAQLATQFPYPKTPDGAWRFAKRIAWTLRSERCGLLQKPEGSENVVHVGDTWYSISRVCYPDGQIYKVISDAGPGGKNGAQWVDDGLVDPARYRPALPLDGAPPAEDPDPPDLEAKVNALVATVEYALARMEVRLTAMEQRRKVAFKTENGHYLCAEGSGGGEVNATRTAVGGWETFTVEPQ